MIVPTPTPTPPTPTETETRRQLEEELGVLLFDPVDEWLLLDPVPIGIDVDKMLSSSSSSSSSPAPLIEEDMKRVKLEEDAPPAALIGADMKRVKFEEDAEEAQMKIASSSQVQTNEKINKPEEEDHKQPHAQSKLKDEEDSSDAESSTSSSDESSSSMDDKHKDDSKEIEEGEILIDSDEDYVEGNDPFNASGMSSNQNEGLPPVPKIDVHLEPHHQTMPIGQILSILGNRVIVEGSAEHSPLNEGSIIWITHTRSPLGLIDETFGPVKSPFYAIRYNSEEDVPSGISVGTAVSFVQEFACHVLNNTEDVYKKGYDIGDEEIDDEVEFSDDEKEAEYKRALRQAKRGSKNRKERRPGPVKTRRDVNFPSKNDGNITPHFTHPIAQSQQNQQSQFSQNQLPQNQFFQNQLLQYQFQQNQLQQNQLPQNQIQQNQFPQTQMSQYQFQQNQLQHNQFPQNQIQHNQFPQNQMPQNQILQNRLLLNLSMLAHGMQIPGLGLPMNTNQNPFMSGGVNFPPPTMQFNPGNMQLNPGNFPSSSERAPLQGNSSIPNVSFSPVNAAFSGERPPVQISTGGQGGNLQPRLESSSFGGECPSMQFNSGQSGSLQFSLGNSSGEGSNLHFGRGYSSNRGGRPHQRGRSGRHFAGRNGNARP